MKKLIIIKRNIMTLLLAVLLAMVLAACGQTDATDTSPADGRKSKENTTVSSGGQSELDTNNGNSEDNTSDTDKNVTAVTTSSITKEELDVDNLFSNRDLEQSPDLTNAETLTVSNGQTIDIAADGIYRITGTASDCTIRVDAGLQDKVQLVLDGVTITNGDFPAIYIVSADKCFITTVADSTLSVTGTFRADGDTNTDAVIFSRDDLTLNGTGTLTLTSAKGNGISCKDDLKVTGGTYVLSTALDTLEANDSIAICGGDFTITTQKDGLHSENDEDNTVGYIYVSGGTFNIQAKSDGIQATTFARFDGGTFKINGSEGIEATRIEVNDGTFDIYGSDDGFNASKKSRSYGTPAIVINGGYVKIEVGQGDTDALDANGDIYVNGGTVDVTYRGMGSFDCDGKAEFNGGTIYINGEQVDSIPQSMTGQGGMGGRGGWGGKSGNGGWGGNGQNPPDGGRGGKGGKGKGNDSDNNSDDNTDSGNYPNFPGNGQMPDFGNAQFPQQPDGSNGYFPNFPNNNDDNGSDADDNSDGRKNNPV